MGGCCQGSGSAQKFKRIKKVSEEVFTCFYFRAEIYHNPSWAKVCRLKVGDNEHCWIERNIDRGAAMMSIPCKDFYAERALRKPSHQQEHMQ